MEIDNNDNNQDSEPDDPTLELAPLSEAACTAMMRADEAAAEPDAVAEAEETQEMGFGMSAPVSDDVASEIQRLRDELKYRGDMNSILRYRNAELHERCAALEEQVSSLSEANESLTNELDRARQQLTSTEQQLAEPGEPDSEVKIISAGPEAEQRRSRGARRTAHTRSPRTGLAPRGEVQDCLVLLGANDIDSGTWVVHDGINTIGSSPDCDIRIQSHFISRHHAQLIKAQNGSVLEDLNSTNGTYINSRRINKRALRPGDLVTIGKHRLQYRKRSDHLVVGDSRGFGSGLQPRVT